MFDKKLLFVAAAFAFPAAASAQVASVGLGAGVNASTQGLTGGVTDTVNSAADTVQQTADKVMPEVSANATVEAGPVVAATATDVTAGKAVLDPKGGTVGKIESVNAEGAVVATGKSRVLLPLKSFAKNNVGLVISLTQAELDAQAAASASAGN
ncbi:hypothetical protein IC614_07320 [Allosphingosinicella flava]|uniref:PRC-barrel domain-containing protein n=1 Tax=Allosphingosinicella flava TaxID=2771430 RepID=A0A7T2GHX8_9SPHN|nr:hypothetical protein [Sphingosinicella flava]QPQ54178.1 hypothetical protein IC614_07320 [Sphingosinicella flava]